MRSLFSKRNVFLSLLLWLIFSGCFVGLYIFRAELYAITEIAPASLAELYPISPNTLAIRAFGTSQKQKLTLELVNAEGCTQWRVSSKGSRTENVVGANPTFLLLPGVHSYMISPQNCQIAAPDVDAIRINVFFGSAESFTVQNLSDDQVQINGVNVPILMDAPSPFQRWVPSTDTMDPNEGNRAAQILTDAGFDPMWPTLRKIEFLVTLIREKMKGGAPPAHLNAMSPLSIFEESSTGKAGVFCRQWSLSYGYLANIAGVPTRNLFTGGAMNTVDMGSHAFSESYIEEEGRWAYVDPTNNIAYVTNSADGVLSGAEIYMASISSNERGLFAHHLSGGRISIVPYEQVSRDVRYFMHRENFLIYIGSYDGRYQMDGRGVGKYFKKLYRFLFQPQQYFGTVSFVSYHWLRAATFFLALTFGVVFAGLAGGAGYYNSRKTLSRQGSL